MSESNNKVPSNVCTKVAETKIRWQDGHKIVYTDNPSVKYMQLSDIVPDFIVQVESFADTITYGIPPIEAIAEVVAGCFHKESNFKEETEKLYGIDELRMHHIKFTYDEVDILVDENMTPENICDFYIKRKAVMKKVSEFWNVTKRLVKSEKQLLWKLWKVAKNSNESEFKDEELREVLLGTIEEEEMEEAEELGEFWNILKKLFYYKNEGLLVWEILRIAKSSSENQLPWDSFHTLIRKL